MKESPKGHSAQGIPTVKFDRSRVTETVQTNLRKDLLLVGGLRPEQLDPLYDVALLSVLEGGNLFRFTNAIMELNLPDMERLQAGELARHINRRAFVQMDRERQTALGITEAIWMYSGAPCLVPGRSGDDNEQDKAHKTANGARFKIGQGLLVDGKWTWPGHDAGCKCFSKPVIPGFG